jgi:ABC-type phosphate transport system substrate-binding protein
MKRLVAAALTSIAAVGLLSLSACGDSKKSGSPTIVSDSAPTGTGSVAPDDGTTPPGDTIASTGLTVPQATIDLMIAQFEQNGIKVDKACFTALLKDDSLRKLLEASNGATPSPEVIQKFIGCLAA